MREQWSPQPVAAKESVPDVWAKPTSFSDAYDKALELGRRLKQASEDPQVREGLEASLRSLINCSIAIADFVPAYGMAASWGADAAKLWAEADHKKRCLEALSRGENPLRVKMHPINLTPDVHWGWAVLTEPLDLCSGDLMPSHAIEGFLQLRADRPRIEEMYRRLREHLRDIQREAQKPELIEAAAAFDVRIAS